MGSLRLLAQWQNRLRHRASPISFRPATVDLQVAMIRASHRPPIPPLLTILLPLHSPLPLEARCSTRTDMTPRIGLTLPLFPRVLSPIFLRTSGMKAALRMAFGREAVAQAREMS